MLFIFSIYSQIIILIKKKKVFRPKKTKENRNQKIKASQTEGKSPLVKENGKPPKQVHSSNFRDRLKLESLPLIPI